MGGKVEYPALQQRGAKMWSEQRLRFSVIMLVAMALSSFPFFLGDNPESEREGKGDWDVDVDEFGFESNRNFVR